jgi:hypothetical protein
VIRFAVPQILPGSENMNRVFVFACVSFFLITACGLHKQSQTSESTNQPATAAKESPAKPVNPGELQPGQASGTYTAKGEVVELKYSYAGRAERFGTDSLVVLVTDKPIPPEALAEEIKSATMLEGEKIRGLEYVFDDNGMWIRYHRANIKKAAATNSRNTKSRTELSAASTTTPATSQTASTPAR